MSIKIRNIFLLSFISIFLISCGGLKNLPGGDARKNPPEPEKRVQKNLEEGRGYRVMDTINKARGKGGGSTNFEFASSNELWRASLDTIDFMPLTSANYSGGVIITDWYSDNNNPNETIKITIRFLSNEIRSDAIDIKVFHKKCESNNNCKISEPKGQISMELIKEILKRATLYSTQKEKNKKKKPYVMNSAKD